MQHAAEISSGDSTDSKIERAMRQRDYFLQQTTAGRSISNTLKAGYECGITAANALRPANVSKALKTAATRFHSMTWAELFVATIKLGWKAARALFFSLFFVIATLYRFVVNLTDDNLDDREHEGQQKTTPQKSTSRGFGGFGQSAQVFPDYNRRSAARDIDAFGVHIAKSESPAPTRSNGDISATATSSAAPEEEQSPKKAANGLKPPPSAHDEAMMADSRRPSEAGGQATAATAENEYLKPPTTGGVGDAPMHRPRQIFQLLHFLKFKLTNLHIFYIVSTTCTRCTAAARSGMLHSRRNKTWPFRRTPRSSVCTSRRSRNN
jgi:hypothetical protein